MKFSIIIPTIGGRDELIGMSIRSVLAQTFQDFEIIVVDGKGSEDTKNAALRYGDKRISYHAVTLEKGGFYTLDYGAQVATGDYVLWLDDDNYLLANAFEIFIRVVEQFNNPDIITASHLYFYDSQHPRHYMRNTIGIVPWRDGARECDPLILIKSLYEFKRRTGGAGLPRLHISAMTVSRRVVVEARQNFGSVVLMDLPNMHSIQPILLAVARSCVYIDHPVTIIGRFGVSMSQRWSTEARRRFKSQVFPITESPVRGHTRINGVLENLLRVKKLSPDKFVHVSVDLEKFAELYIAELVYLDNKLATIISDWRDAFVFLSGLKDGQKGALCKRAHLLAVKSVFIYFIRRMGLHHLARLVRGIGIFRRYGKIRSGRMRVGGREFEIGYKKYGIRTIEELGHKAGDILKFETGRDIFSLTLELK